MGVNASWTDLTWTLRAVYGQTDLDGSANSGALVIDGEQAQFTGVGGSYDNGSFIAITEWTTVEIDGLLADTESAYVTLGYRIKAFTPYVTMAYTKTTDDDVRAALPPQLAIPLGLGLNQERTAYSAGLRWDAIDNVAIKFDLTYATDFGDTSGGLGGNAVVNPLTKQFMFDDTLVYTVKFDAVF
ncbi:hypothetical protein [Shewanella sp. OMA3-2]|uniref:hypothetical protein n=1 Tax=Shewanella sp. OMA3-2 TaxID=2908650 RepID=UPI001F3864C7|nr:hypothetical protein [Shewanella sp. OMA3-2]UJF20644.1 hypothetical protein L0B17_10550 [Shewanella sp. OMA3-2]